MDQRRTESDSIYCPGDVITITPTPCFTRSDIDDAWFEQRSLVKQLAMRRTVFVSPRDLLPAAISSPSARIARQEHGRLVKDLERNQVAHDGATWLTAARRAVLDRLV